MESNPREPLLVVIGENPPTDECSGADISESRTSPRRTPPPPPPPHSLLGLGVAKNRPADESSGSGADISESGTSPRRSPPPPSPPLLGLGSPKSGVNFFSSSPSLPAHDIAKNQSASFSSPSLTGGLDFDPEAPRCRTPQQSPSAPSAPHGGTSKNSDGANIPSPVSTRKPPSDREGLGNETSSSPSSRAWWGLFGRLRRRAPPRLPVSAPRSGRLDGFRKSIQDLRQRGARLDSVGVERVIGIFGFSLFGSLSLFPYTIDRIKDFATVNKSIVMFSFGLVWVLASVGVVSRLQGKSDFEQAFCRFTGRLGVIGLAFLVIFQIWWTLPGDNHYCTGGFYTLLALAFVLHILSWGMSFLVREDRIEDKKSPDAQD